MFLLNGINQDIISKSELNQFVPLFFESLSDFFFPEQQQHPDVHGQARRNQVDEVGAQVVGEIVELCHDDMI